MALVALCCPFTDVIPQPLAVARKPGTFVLDGRTCITVAAGDEAANTAAELL